MRLTSVRRVAHARTSVHFLRPEAAVNLERGPCERHPGSTRLRAKSI